MTYENDVTMEADSIFDNEFSLFDDVVTENDDTTSTEDVVEESEDITDEEFERALETLLSDDDDVDDEFDKIMESLEADDDEEDVVTESEDEDFDMDTLEESMNKIIFDSYLTQICEKRGYGLTTEELDIIMEGGRKKETLRDIQAYQSRMNQSREDKLAQIARAKAIAAGVKASKADKIARDAEKEADEETGLATVDDIDNTKIKTFVNKMELAVMDDKRAAKKYLSKGLTVLGGICSAGGLLKVVTGDDSGDRCTGAIMAIAGAAAALTAYCKQDNIEAAAQIADAAYIKKTKEKAIATINSVNAAMASANKAEQKKLRKLKSAAEKLYKNAEKAENKLEKELMRVEVKRNKNGGVDVNPDNTIDAYVAEQEMLDCIDDIIFESMLDDTIDGEAEEVLTESKRTSAKLRDLGSSDMTSPVAMKQVYKSMKRDEYGRKLSKGLSKIGLAVSGLSAGKAVMDFAQGNDFDANCSIALSVAGLLSTALGKMSANSVTKDEVKNVVILREKIQAAKDKLDATPVTDEKSRKELAKRRKQLDKLYKKIENLNSQITKRIDKETSAAGGRKVDATQAKVRHETEDYIKSEAYKKS